MGISLAVAVYVTKVPIPFVDRGVSGSVEADKAEMVRNKNWDPNAAVVKVEPPKDLAGINLPEGVDPPPIPSDSANASDADIPAPAVTADPLGALDPLGAGAPVRVKKEPAGVFGAAAARSAQWI